MYKLEYLNEHRDWINGGWYKNYVHAEINAEVKEQGGCDTRIIEEGKIIREGCGK